MRCILQLVYAIRYMCNHQRAFSAGRSCHLAMIRWHIHTELAHRDACFVVVCGFGGYIFSIMGLNSFLCTANKVYIKPAS